ncbi:hypothetical protein GCM10007096_04690 [Pullulanibacillus pueri]|uniref:Uncharacterized protein n=1 Tax=Pullulanibacillus pueri TaxID=1437324 RepID=A0A8J2ZTK7_9BACL|nr:hypothetical protein GCM10007096_04690 [Pullulanibacillus pueri]
MHSKRGAPFNHTALCMFRSLNPNGFLYGPVNVNLAERPSWSYALGGDDPFKLYHAIEVMESIKINNYWMLQDFGESSPCVI